MQVPGASGADIMFGILWSISINVKTKHGLPDLLLFRLKPLKVAVFFLLCGRHAETDAVFAGTLPRATI